MHDFAGQYLSYFTDFAVVVTLTVNMAGRQHSALTVGFSVFLWEECVMLVRLILFSALMFFAGALPSANAGVMYGVTGAGSSPSSLYTIDTTTGAATLVGATGMSHITGLDFDPTSGILYGVVSAGFAGPSTLVTIDKATGAATLVGSLGVSGVGNIPDISFNSSGALFGWTEDSDDLISINKATGTALVVGDAGIGTFQTGLAFGTGDTLYVKPGTDLYTVNPVTGIATFATGLSGSGESPVNALEYDANSDILYSISGSGNSGGRSSFLSIIDPVGGTWTNVGDMGVLNMAAIAVDSGVAAVPEPSSLLMLSIGAAALVAIRRRKALSTIK